MLPLREIRGLKFPDEYVVRHFFKRGLAERAGRVIELGCGSGNNLSLYQSFDWTCIGVDRDASALDDARHNLGEEPQLISADLSDGLPALNDRFDAVLIPNMLCYLTEGQSIAVLSSLKRLMAPGCELFVRTRLIDDYRYGRGIEEETDGFRLSTAETGEAGLFNRFYTRHGLVELLTRTVGLGDRVELAVRFDNIQDGRRISGNSDLVVWGRVQ